MDSEHYIDGITGEFFHMTWVRVMTVLSLDENSGATKTTYHTFSIDYETATAALWILYLMKI